MQQRLKTSLIVAVSVIFTFVATAYFAREATLRAFKAQVFEMEAFNSVGSIETYDTVESLLVKGCNKEALELVRMQQSFLLSALKYEIGHDEILKDKIMARNPEITERAYKPSPQRGSSEIPSC